MNAFNDPQVAKKILESYKVFAIVGCSADPGRPSNSVAHYLMRNGYDVIPVNPNEQQCFGKDCYPNLRSIPFEVEVVDIFRRSEFVAPHVDEAIEVGAKAIWMQLGVIDADAAGKAAAAGLDVVMDRCPAIDHPRMIART
jgi:predicted CoA-binding protein